MVFADSTAGNSAVLISSSKQGSIAGLQKIGFYKKMAIKKVMEQYNSPMIPSLDAFMVTCEKYSLNCYLLPSIAVLESTFGRFIYPNSYNPFGWGGGYILFENWDEGINTVGKGLRTNYVNKGAETIEQIGKIYSESPTWAVRVNLIQSQFEKVEQEMQLYLNADAVQL